MTGRSTGALAMGIFFILAGGAFLLEALDVWSLRAGQLWPLLLLGFGSALLIGSRLNGSNDDGAP